MRFLPSLGLLLCSIGLASPSHAVETTTAQQLSTANLSVAGVGLVDTSGQVIPESFVYTPNGYLPSECVVRLLPGDNISAAGDIVHRADGSLVQLAACSSAARVPASGGSEIIGPPLKRLSGNASIQGSTGSQTPHGVTGLQGYFADITQSLSSNVGGAQEEWVVPSGPSTVGTYNLITYWFGLEPSSSAFVFQPILGFNVFNDQAWSISAWYCASSCAVSSTYVPVSVGDTILGTVSGSSCSSGVCSTWVTGIQDLNISGSYISTTTTSVSTSITYILGAVLEAYNIDLGTCSEMPPTGANVAFINTGTVDTTGSPISSINTPANWTLNANMQPYPPATQCDWSVSATQITTPTQTEIGLSIYH